MKCLDNLLKQKFLNYVKWLREKYDIYFSRGELNILFTRKFVSEMWVSYVN